MSTRRRVTAAIDGSVVIFRGWQVAHLLKDANMKPIFAASAGGWMIDQHRLADVLAYLDRRNIAVAVTGGTETIRTPDEGVGVNDDLDDVIDAHPTQDSGLW